jgi:hypothetical protein
MNDLSELILDTAKGADAQYRTSYEVGKDEGYLEGRRDGYEGGWAAACKAALALTNKSQTQDVAP